MAIQSCYITVDIVVPHRSAGACAGIRIDARLQSQRMDIISHGEQAIGETLWVGYNASFLIPIAEEAIVDIHILITQLAQP